MKQNTSVQVYEGKGINPMRPLPASYVKWAKCQHELYLKAESFVISHIEIDGENWENFTITGPDQATIGMLRELEEMIEELEKAGRPERPVTAYSYGASKSFHRVIGKVIFTDGDDFIVVINRLQDRPT